MLGIFRRLIPRPIRNLYHTTVAFIAAAWFGFPARRLRVVGITGTHGKSSVAMLVGQVLMAAGYRVGWSSTATIRLGEREWLNRSKMTMPGGFALQRLLRDMSDDGCSVALIETSSEGLVQHRHIGIAYDVAVFLNLATEHLEAHGGWERYRRAKERLFVAVARRREKRIGGKLVPRMQVVNMNDPETAHFLLHDTDERWGFSGKSQIVTETSEKVSFRAPDGNALRSNGVDSARNLTPRVLTQPCEISPRFARRNDTGWSSAEVPTESRIIQPDVGSVRAIEWGSEFRIDGQRFIVHLPGAAYVENALATIAIARSFGVSLERCALALEAIDGLPGRMERIDEGRSFTVVVDYAHTPDALTALYAALGIGTLTIRPRVIHVLGGVGGGRDHAKRPAMGAIAGHNADLVVVTNEDPYDDDPLVIIRDVADGARSAGRAEVVEVSDRRDGITLALARAAAGDLVLITGKGCEQAIVCAGGEKVPWDDRVVIREELRRLCADNRKS
ncbi:MAG: Mur ligase family protein [Candidatus Uhrbacteria bacterium]